MRVVVKQQKTKDGKRSFPVYSIKTAKGEWFKARFVGDAQAPASSCYIEIEEDQFFVAYEKDQETGKLVLTADGSKIIVVIINGEYKQISEDAVCDELKMSNSSLYDAIKDLF